MEENVKQALTLKKKMDKEELIIPKLEADITNNFLKNL